MSGDVTLHGRPVVTVVRNDDKVNFTLVELDRNLQWKKEKGSAEVRFKLVVKGTPVMIVTELRVFCFGIHGQKCFFDTSPPPNGGERKKEMRCEKK